MTKEIQVEMIIDGKPLKTFSRLQIRQAFNAHHSFELVVDQDALEERESHTLHKSQDYIGRFLTVCFGQDPSHNSFKGIITEVGLAQDKGLWGSLVLKGYSPTYLMEGGSHRASFCGLGLKELFKEALVGLAANDMEIINTPRYTEAIPYICQYGESNFAFVNRLSAQYSEFFYYDGQHLFFGKPKPDNLDMVYGQHIESMHFAMRLAPSHIHHYSYNAKEDQVLSSQLPKTLPRTDNYTAKALDVSAKLYRMPLLQPVDIRANNTSEIDTYAQHHKARLAAGAVVLQAQGDEPKLKLGMVINLTMSHNDFSEAEKEHGAYLVTALTHTLGGTGTYKNSFEAIPATNEVIPFTAPAPLAQTQIATVKENADPAGQGRVRVQMLWQQPTGACTDWIRVMTSDAGSSAQVDKNRGSVFIPEIGDQVMVGFRYNDPNRPFVLGSMFHGQIAEGGGKDNSLKSIKTRSGHTLEFNDTEGAESITITDKNKNIIILDTANSSITISAPETMTLKAKNLLINVDEKMTTKVGQDSEIDVGADMKISVNANHSLSIKGSHEISSKETTETVKGDKTVAIDGDLNVKTDATKITSKGGDIAFKSGKEALLQGKSGAKVSKG